MSPTAPVDLDSAFAALADSTRRAVIRELQPNSPMYRVFTMERLAANATASLSFTMLMVGIAAVLALVLGAVGLYGVLSYRVTQRKREIGVRMALGARRGEVLGQVLKDGMKTAVAGLLLGSAGAYFVTQAIINTAPEAYPTILAGFHPDLPAFLSKCRDGGREGIEAAYKDRTYMTEDVIKRFSVAGTAEDCVAKIKEISSFGIDDIWLRCFSAPRSEIEHEKVIVPFAEKVMPAFA